MNKKGSINFPLAILISVVTFLLVFGVGYAVFSKGRSIVKKTDIDDEEKNKISNLVRYINALRVEDEEKTYTISIEGNFQMEVYGKCEKNEQPGIDYCSTRAKICLRDNSNNRLHCEDVKNTDLESNGKPLVAVKGLKLKKTEENGKEVTRVYI